jgi:glycosyltransferase involved in cell wall biosynthesis
MPTYSRRQSSSETTVPFGAPDLVVFSHLRWSWVWQRPQQLMSRLAASHHTWFIEEPFVDADIDRPSMCWTTHGRITVGRLHIPGPDRHVGFDAPEAAQLFESVSAAVAGEVPILWLYTPLAYPAAQAIAHHTLVFDVMDDLASFKGASPHLKSLHMTVLDEADIVFTGGRSLHNSVTTRRPDNTYLFPSGVETEHYAHALKLRQPSDRPVAGYVGVIDERLDLDLVAAAADLLPEWCFMMVGPVAKIDPAELPQRPNIQYMGPVTYEQLPEMMAKFHVALMPFAHNEATRSISPTKTLEYLAAGLRVVSTSVPDVVNDYGHLVHLGDDPETFAQACVEAFVDADDALYHARCTPVLEWRHWDGIAKRMAAIMADAEAARMGRSA